MEKGCRDVRWEAPVAFSSCLVGLVLSTFNVVNFEEGVHSKKLEKQGQPNLQVIEADQNSHYYLPAYALKPEEDQFVECWENFQNYNT